MAQGLSQLMQGMGQSGNQGKGQGQNAALGHGLNPSQGNQGQGQGQGNGQGNGPSTADLLAGLSSQLSQMKTEMQGSHYLAGTSGTAQSNWGYGTSNMKVGSSPGGKNGEKSQRDIKGSGSERTAVDFNPMYAPEQAPSKSYDTRVKGQIGSGGTTMTQTIKSLPSDSKGLSEYYNIVAAYTGAGESALDDQSIPPEYRDLIKNYFNKINEQAAGGADKNGDKSKDSAGKDGKDSSDKSGPKGK